MSKLIALVPLSLFHCGCWKSLSYIRESRYVSTEQGQSIKLSEANEGWDAVSDGGMQVGVGAWH